MSYNFNLVVVEGDHRDTLVPWFEAAGYKIVRDAGENDSVLTVRTKASGERTFLFGDQFLDEADLQRIVNESNSRVVELMCGGTAEAYGLQCYAVGEPARIFSVLEGEVLQDDGPTMPEEASLCVDASTGEEEMLELASRFGFDPNQPGSTVDYALDYSSKYSGVTFPGVVESNAQRRQDRLGRILTTAACLIFACVMFTIAPRSESIPWPIEFVMFYGLATVVLTVVYGASLLWILKWDVFPEHWGDVLDGGFWFQWKLSVVFLIAFAAAKLAGAL